MEQQYVIGIELTRHCNLRCVHCLRDDVATVEEFPFQLFKRIVAEARCFGRPHIAFTGGEPTMHSRFAEIIGVVFDAGLSCHFVTNGRQFDRVVSQLTPYRLALSAVSFSIDGATEQTHDAVRGRGSFREVLMAIALARFNGLDVTLQMAVNRRNRGEMAAMAEMAAELGAVRLYFCHSQLTRRLVNRGLDLSPEQWHEVEREVDAIRRSGVGLAPMLTTGSYGPGLPAPCPALQNRSLNIDYRGRLTLCCQLSGVAPEGEEQDIIADLQRVSLAEGLQEVVGAVARVIGERTTSIFAHTGSANDGFHCWYCYKRFGLVGWLSQHPEHAWTRGDPFFAAPPALRQQPRDSEQPCDHPVPPRLQTL